LAATAPTEKSNCASAKRKVVMPMRSSIEYRRA
jgi:hypothetical protein